MNEKDFELSEEILDTEKRTQALESYLTLLSDKSQYFMGYQNVQLLNFEDDIKKFLNFHINNIGDPFVSGNFSANSKVIECAVLDYYAKLWNAKTPHNIKDPESYWGYVLTMGSTEGNLYGLWNARDYLAGKKLIIDKEHIRKGRRQKMRYRSAIQEKDNPQAYTPVAFFSEDTHYSIVKAMRVLKVPTFYDIGEKYYPGQNPLNPTGEWTRDNFEVPSENGKFGTGAIDIDKLEVLVEFFASKGYPILIICNYGTTFKGAYDDVKAIGERLIPIFKKYGLVNRKIVYDEVKNDIDTRNGYWIHVDGALGAAYMPFIEKAFKKNKIDICGPIFDFRLPFVNSIVMSGHKWIGSPWPCGLFMTKVKYQLFPPDAPEYIGSPDTTFAGSRNGLSALILWDYLAQNSYNSQIDRAISGQKMAQYAQNQLKIVQEHHSMDLWIERTPLALTVRLRKPSDKIVQKYALSCETFLINGEERHYAHIYLMNSVTKELVDKFIEDLKQPDAFE